MTSSVTKKEESLSILTRCTVTDIQYPMPYEFSLQNIILNYFALNEVLLSGALDKWLKREKPLRHSKASPDRKKKTNN